ncbi:hypothetical protein [Clostridium tetani]|uniref:hypothetical protein n=1 Tax=Clostridium tetani TaxID=1513 RepID=UPI00100BA5ED|nr:hypothetical protein [Clostridium tetani]RXM74395.1 hypothetical protein DP143_00435 [Clostridium tetani]
MQNIFLGLTLGKDPHTVGIHKAGKIARMAGIGYKILPPAMSDEEKIRIIIKENPKYIGLSYRLSIDKAINELEKFLYKLDQYDIFQNSERRICFAGLVPTLDAVRSLGLDKKYKLVLMGSDKNITQKTLNTIGFFKIQSNKVINEILDMIIKESEPIKIEVLDQLAKYVIENEEYLLEPALKKPSDKALNYFPQRMKESSFPLIRTHFGIPDESIIPTIKGIEKIAENGAVDEISLGSSDLSQRYFGNIKAFEEHKNDGGVPYKTKEDLRMLYLATRRGNFPSIKPYAHVYQLKRFVDNCLETGMLIGAHQAVPLFWFSELDGRGPLSVPDAIEEHIETVSYLASRYIPVEMNDPNQWSSRFVHDTLFVVDYALIASVMYNAGVNDMIFQCQFNKPAETGDFADLAKMSAAKEIIELLRPAGNRAKIFMESRAGIEHFSIDLEIAKYQLARTTLLQMILNPEVIHLVSYCEADHAATAEDVIESSKIVRKAVRVFKENEPDLKKILRHSVILQRKEYLLKESKYVLNHITKLSDQYYKGMDINEYYKCLSDSKALAEAMKIKLMSAPGITHPDYVNPDMLTKAGEYGFIDCYENWDDKIPMSEERRISLLYNNS